MIRIIDEHGRVRAAKPGEGVRFRDGTKYIVGERGELRTEQAKSSKRPTPGKAARKARRAAMLNQMRKGRDTSQADAN
jgi:hypothetical protein